MLFRSLLSSTSSFDGDAIGFNLIGEIKGSTQPENIILITAHIDSWFNSQGAQDNATGCAQAVEILRIFSKIGIKPRNTIRVMIYQDEEISMSGMKKYIELYGNENHLYNLELDSGAEEPIGFTLFDSEKHYNDITSKIAPSLQVELSQIPIEEASFWPLSAAKNTPVYFYMAQRKSYFSIHHSQVDNIDSINPVNIQKSSNIIASFVYLSDL